MVSKICFRNEGGIDMVIGLDWDDTVSEYSVGFRKLVECATEIHIITSIS